MPQTSAPASSRFAGVDILRGIAIISVVLLHTGGALASQDRSLSNIVPPSIFIVFFENILDGVSVFFAISGFLITYTCLRRFGALGNTVPQTFYRIRFARIAPLLLLLLAILSGLQPKCIPGLCLVPSVTTLPRALFAALTFHINWLEAARGYLPAPWAVLWSLSIEEMFYLFFPLACLLLRWRKGRIFFAALLLGLLIAGPFTRTVWAAGNTIWKVNNYYSGMSTIAMGCITAIVTDAWQRRRRTPPNSILLAIIGCGILDILFIILPSTIHYTAPLWRSGTGTTVLTLGVCAILFGTVLRNRPAHVWSAPLRWFGTNSYEIYLLHIFVLFSLDGPAGVHTSAKSPMVLLWAAAMLGLSGIVGWLAARFFSEPMNRLLRGARPPKPAHAH